jgi:L-asparaginase / beta-aspartyl-peptidase
MRLNLTKDVSDLMQYKGWSLKHAVDYEIYDKLVKLGGENTGGLIALDRKGEIATAFNTPGMYRGWIDTQGHMVIGIFKHE